MNMVLLQPELSSTVLPAFGDGDLFFGSRHLDNSARALALACLHTHKQSCVSNSAAIDVGAVLALQNLHA